MVSLTCTALLDIQKMAFEKERRELLEAAEFESRVVKKLATDENCGVDEDCPPNMPFGWGRLKAARLAVEEEIDGTD